MSFAIRSITIVSIHAPARGATGTLSEMEANKQFQSTPLREGRPEPMPFPRYRHSFNPRPCARGDYDTPETMVLSEEFQSTPLREGRLPAAGQWLTRKPFQSTPLREGRPAAMA